MTELYLRFQRCLAQRWPSLSLFAAIFLGTFLGLGTAFMLVAQEYLYVAVCFIPVISSVVALLQPSRPTSVQTERITPGTDRPLLFSFAISLLSLSVVLALHR